MRLVVTGGGTGGHVYPALEVARHAREQGDELLYLGSLRGQEGAAAAAADVPFQGFAAAPLYSLKTPRGWKSAVMLLRAVGTARSLLRIAKPDVVFSTGGYSAAPVISAARKLGIPYVLFEANSIPGRTHRMFARDAAAFASVFRKTESVLPDVAVTRTGMPVRKALRDAAQAADEGAFSDYKNVGRSWPTRYSVVVLGGSQGSAFLNEVVPLAATGSKGTFLHATGPSNYASIDKHALPDGYRMLGYLEQDELIRGLRYAKLAVARSGGTLAELACFRLPSVLVPLPTSADDHQLWNAREFEAMGAATVLEQGQATSETMRNSIREWLEADVSAAQNALAQWDCPNATEEIYGLISRAANPSS